MSLQKEFDGDRFFSYIILFYFFKKKHCYYTDCLMLSRINVHTPRHIYTKYNYMHKCIITVFKFTQWQYYELLILPYNSFFIKMQKKFFDFYFLSSQF